MNKFCWCETIKEIDSCIKAEIMPVTDLRIISAFYYLDRNQFWENFHIIRFDEPDLASNGYDIEWLVHFSPVQMILDEEIE